jgi:protein-S-isoprenylcysteine O-methyltransferase Ste14
MKTALRWLDGAVFLCLASLVFAQWPWDTRHAIGFAISACCFAFWMTARVQLGRSFSVGAEAKKLVTRGIYSRIRHPVYVFGTGAYAGVVIAWNHPIGYALLACAIALQLWRIRNEDAVLDRAFGEDYRRYRARTWF